MHKSQKAFHLHIKQQLIFPVASAPPWSAPTTCWSSRRSFRQTFSLVFCLFPPETLGDGRRAGLCEADWLLGVHVVSAFVLWSTTAPFSTLCMHSKLQTLSVCELRPLLSSREKTNETWRGEEELNVDYRSSVHEYVLIQLLSLLYEMKTELQKWLFLKALLVSNRSLTACKLMRNRPLFSVSSFLMCSRSQSLV